MYIRFIFMLAALAILTMSGCYYDNEEELYPNSFCDTANVTYAGTIDRIVRSQCATPGCHAPGGSGNGDFTDFAQLSVKVADGRFLRSVRRAPGALAMPPNTSLRPCEVAQIELWIAEGARNN